MEVKSKKEQLYDFKLKDIDNVGDIVDLLQSAGYLVIHRCDRS